MHTLANPLARDDRRSPAAEPSLAIPGDGELERYMRAALTDPSNMPGMSPSRLIHSNPDFDRYARIAQPPMTGACDLRVGIDHGGHDARNSGLHDGVTARRRPAMVRTGLERHVKRRSAGGRARASQSFRFGMRPPA
jgi:hypothetical protein